MTTMATTPFFGGDSAAPTQTSTNSPSNAFDVLSLALSSISSVEATQDNFPSLPTSIPNTLSSQDATTGIVFFSIPYPSVETGPPSDVMSTPTTTFSLPLSTAMSSAPSDSAMPTSAVSPSRFQISSTQMTSSITPSSISASSFSSTSSTSLSSSSTSSLSSSSTSSLSSSSTSSLSSTRTTSSSSSSSSSLTTTHSASAATSSSAAVSLKNPEHLSAGAIAGIVIGVGIGILLLAALLLYLLRKRTHRPLPQNPPVYPEEAYLYDPHIDIPPRTVGANGHGVPPGPGPGTGPEMGMAGERDGLLGGGATGLGVGAATAAARRQGNRASRNDRGPLDPFADPHEAERWPLNPDGQNGTLHPDELDPAGPGYTAEPGVSQGGVEVAVSAAGRPPVGVGGWGGRSVGPQNYDIPGRYGPGGVVRGANIGRGRASGVGSSGPGEDGLSPAMREVRRAWGWESSGPS